MRTLRMSVSALTLAALIFGSMAVPAAAATPGRMAVVNGIPGTRVDVCIGATNEIRSGLPYGSAFKQKLTGVKKLRFRKAGPGRCKGALLAGRTLGFAAGSDKTLVLTSQAPRVLVFDNLDLGIQPAADESALALRHAADLTWNTVHFRALLWGVVDDRPLPPNTAAVDPDAYEKGDQRTQALSVSSVRLQVQVYRPDDIAKLRESAIFEVMPLRRYEFIFVGTNAANSRLVRLTSALAIPPAPQP